jgi:hypothetical protein
VDEKLYKIELTTSQLNTLKNGLHYARLFYADKKYLTDDFVKLANLADSIDIQTIEGEII